MAFQDRFGVITDRSQFDTLFFEARFSPLQLDQLPSAVASPIGRTEEEKNCTVGGSERVQVLVAAKLIAQRKRGGPLARLKTDRGQLCYPRNTDRVVVQRAFDGYAISEIWPCLILGVELVDLPDSVVVQRKSATRPAFLETFIGFRKGLLRRAAAIDDNTGPRP
jgi:hypothetical protein